MFPRMKKSSVSVLRYLVLLACLLIPLSAYPSTITTVVSPTGRATFGATDTVDWGLLGPSSTVVSNPFGISSAGGIGLTVSQVGSTFERRDAPSGWFGNFTDGSVLLWTGGGNGPVTLAFAGLIRGVGFQINPDGSDTETAVQVFGAGNTLFATFDLTTADRSAASADFIGFTSDATDIASIVVSQTVNDFAINQLSLITGGDNLEPVPEPATLLLLGSSLAGLGLARWRQRRRLES